MASQIGCGLAWSAQEPKAMRDKGGAALRRDGSRRQGGGGHELGEGAAVEHQGHRKARIAGLVGTIMKRHLKHAPRACDRAGGRGRRLHRETSAALSRPGHGGLAKWPPIARLEAWLAGCRRGRALLAFVAPSILILPIKLCRCLVRAAPSLRAVPRQCCHRQDAGDGAPGAALPHPAADPDDDAWFCQGRHLVLLLARPAYAFVSPCRPGRRRPRWCSACVPG